MRARNWNCFLDRRRTCCQTEHGCYVFVCPHEGDSVACIDTVLTSSPWETPPGLWRPDAGPRPGRRWCPRWRSPRRTGSGSACTAGPWARWRRRCRCSPTGSPSSPGPRSAPRPSSSAGRCSCPPRSRRDVRSDEYREGKNIWMWYWDVEGRLSHHFLVQSGDHLLQLLVAFLQVLLCSLQGVQLCLSSVHLLLHPPAQLVAHSRDQGRTDRVLPDGAISVRAWRESIEEAEWATQKRLGLMHVCFNIYLFRSGSLILILRFFHYSYIIFYIIWFHFLHFTYGWQLMSVGNMELPLSLHHSSLCKWADTHGCPERYSLESALQMSELIQPCDLSSLRANTKYRRRLKPILPFTARNTFWASNVTVGHLATVSKPSIKVKILNVNCHVLNRHPSNT